MTRKKRTSELNTRFPIKDSELQVAVTRIPTKELTAFDFGLRFRKGTKEVQIYIDESLRDSINGLLELYGEVILKVNAFSPDVVMITGSNANASVGSQEPS